MSIQSSSLPSQLPVGIVHLGLGAFHRAHQAYYTEEAISRQGGDWGICAVAMRSRQLAKVMKENDGRYSLIEQQPDRPALREISVIREILCLTDEPETVAARIADPSVHVITVTVTEKGYCFSGADRCLNQHDPGIVHDLSNPLQSRTMPGILVAGLQQRRKADGSGLTIISCDNLPANGGFLRGIVMSFAELLDPSLVGWISESCRFPDTMVDRITPAASSATLALAEQILGRPDPAAIETEPFVQWVIENDFAGPHPAWDVAGAEYVDNVAPYEEMKLRMLNGSHSLIAYLGAVTGMSAVRDVMAIPAYRALVTRHMTQAAETLEQVDEAATSRYRERLLSRFENPAIDHRCLQIAMDGSQKLPQRIFTPAVHRLKNGQSTESFALVTALWFRYLGGVNEQGEAIDCRDPLAAELITLVRGSGSLAERVAALGQVPGVPQGLFDNADWVEAVSDLIARIESDGVPDTVAHISQQYTAHDTAH